MAAPGSWTHDRASCPTRDLSSFRSSMADRSNIHHRQSTARPGSTSMPRSSRNCARHVVGPVSRSRIPELVQRQQTDRNPRRSQGHEDPQFRRRGQAGAPSSWARIPNTTPWPNVPLALSQGTFDGLMTLERKLVSAKLWDSGMKMRYGGPPVHRRIHSRSSARRSGTSSLPSCRKS